MHAAIQPPEKDGTELPPRGVRPHQGAAASSVGPLATAFVWPVRLWALILPVVTDGSSTVFWWVFHLSLICAFSEYAFLKCAFSCLLRLSMCHT